MILIDYSQMSLAAILSFQRELQQEDQKVVDLIRHVILSSIQNYKKKYSREYGDIVICCDAGNYWRKDIFPYYKAGRKKSREDSNLNWKLIFDTMSEMRKDISEHFPYKVIHVDKAEADDVIAVISEWSQTNALTSVGLFEEPQKVIIISSDHDFKQLQKYENVSQYSPRMKKLIKAEKNYMKVGHIEHIVKAGDDGIPSILNPDDIFIQEGVRQKPLKSSRVEEFIEKGFDACKNDEERRNWHRNRTLIDFDCIPQEIKDKIIDTFINTKVVKDKTLIMNYLIRKRCRVLLDNIEDF